MAVGITLDLWKSLITDGMIDMSQVMSKLNMASPSHNKNIENSRLSPSIYTFSSLFFHKPLTYDRNHTNPDRYTIVKINLHSMQRQNGSQLAV